MAKESAPRTIRRFGPPKEEPDVKVAIVVPASIYQEWTENALPGERVSQFILRLWQAGKSQL